MSVNKPEPSKNQGLTEKIKEKYEKFKKDRELKKRRRNRQKAEKKYEEKLNKTGRTTKSRKKQHDAHHRWGKRLIIANIVIFVLLIVAIWMVFFV